MKTTLLLITSASILLTSCDSTNILSPGTDDAKLATVLQSPADGDTIVFNNTDGKAEPFLPQLVLSGATTSTPNLSFEYRQVSSQQFDIDVVLRNNQGLSLAPAVNNLIGEPTTLSSRFRQLIFRDEADFTAAELQEIIDLLNPSGASLLIDPEDPNQILSTSDRKYRFEVRSTVADQILGSMGGVYFAQENSLIVDFREPTGTELNTYRFLTLKHKIPFLTGERNKVQITERGTFVLDLANRNGQPRLLE